MKMKDSSAEFGWKLFPTNLPSSQWVQFEAEGFSKPVCGVIYRFDRPATNGLAL
jgi:hypothetical protein